jgi:hypothetical protein
VSSKEKAVFPGGKAEVREFQHASGQSPADARFEAAAELAVSKLRHALAQKQPAVTSAQVADYYAHHQSLFAIPERRELLITNRKTPAQVAALKKEVASGRSFAAMSQPYTAERPSAASRAAEPETALEKAIYSAKPKVLTGPVKHWVDVYVFEVLRIKPPSHRPLAQVHDLIERRLAAERRRRAIAQFAKTWWEGWTAKTDCEPGYVVNRCRQYTGSPPGEVSLALS